MTIKDLTVNASFKYLWLKKISGINLNVHCARCLLGEYDERISPKINSYNDITLAPGIYYLCGVSAPYVWKNNFHLAFTDCEGCSVNYESNGIHIVIDNAKQLPISISYCDKANPHYSVASYRTCRNWQFANYLKDSDLL